MLRPGASTLGRGYTKKCDLGGLCRCSDVRHPRVITYHYSHTTAQQCKLVNRQRGYAFGRWGVGTSLLDFISGWAHDDTYPLLLYGKGKRLKVWPKRDSPVVHTRCAGCSACWRTVMP